MNTVKKLKQAFKFYSGGAFKPYIYRWGSLTEKLEKNNINPFHYLFFIIYRLRAPYDERRDIPLNELEEGDFSNLLKQSWISSEKIINYYKNYSRKLDEGIKKILEGELSKVSNLPEEYTEEDLQKILPFVVGHPQYKSYIIRLVPEEEIKNLMNRILGTEENNRN